MQTSNINYRRMFTSMQLIGTYILLAFPPLTKYWAYTNGISLVDGLKLTPVQQLTQRVDLMTESQSTSKALYIAAMKKQQVLDSLLEEGFDISMQELWESAEFNRLKQIIKRWDMIGSKLRGALQLGNAAQVIVKTVTNFYKQT